MKRLKKVANQHIIRRRVRLDGHAFIGCTFVDCILEFSGGDVSIEDTLFVRPAIEMDGPASNTTEVLRVLGALKEEMFTFADEKP